MCERVSIKCFWVDFLKILAAGIFVFGGFV